MRQHAILIPLLHTGSKPIAAYPNEVVYRLMRCNQVDCVLADGLRTLCMDPLWINGF